MLEWAGSIPARKVDDMDAKELAQKMLEWQVNAERQQVLEKEISEAVLEIGKTQTVGNCRATFSKPRKSYQSWEDVVIAFANDIDKIKEKFTVVPEPFIDWQAAGKYMNVERNSWIPEGAKPSVRVKLI